MREKKLQKEKLKSLFQYPLGLELRVHETKSAGGKAYVVKPLCYVVCNSTRPRLRAGLVITCGKELTAYRDPHIWKMLWPNTPHTPSPVLKEGQ